MKNINNGTNLTLIKRLAKLGLTDTEIAQALEMKTADFRKLKEIKRISNALSQGREYLDRQVEHALFSRAVGFDFDEVTKSKSEKSGSVKETAKKSGKSKSKVSNESAAKKKELVKDSKPIVSEGETTKSVHKIVIPDVTACIFWLRNRQPEKWREMKEKESGELLKEMIVSYCDEEDEKETQNSGESTNQINS